MLLADGEDRIAVRDHSAELIRVLFDLFVHLDLGQDLPDFVISPFLEDVKVLSDSTLEQEGCLRDIADLPTQGMQAYLFQINSIDLDRPFIRIDKSEQNLEDRALTASRPANDTHFHARLDLKA